VAVVAWWLVMIQEDSLREEQRGMAILAGKEFGRFRGIFLIYYKKSSGKPRIAYEDAVEEALCFGCIDGRVNKLDEERYVSEIHSTKTFQPVVGAERAVGQKLIAGGKMTAAGLTVFNPARKPAQPTQLPGDLKQKFKGQADAWKNFQRFPPFYRRMIIACVARRRKKEPNSSACIN
jgi:uncharacterized protein YdeI (YjbR/CyaY-like superfamily)